MEALTLLETQEATPNNPDEDSDFAQKNFLARAIIDLSLSQPLRNKYAKYHNAKALWNAIQREYERTDNAAVFEALGKLINAGNRKYKTVEERIGYFKLWEQKLKTGLGTSDLPDALMAAFLLRSLPDAHYWRINSVVIDATIAKEHVKCQSVVDALIACRCHE